MTSPRKQEEPVPTILIVHADARVSERLQFVLSGAGLEVSATPDNDEAISRLRRLNPDLVLIDLGLATAEAGEFTSMLRDSSLGRRVPFIVLSDGPPAQASRAALEIGAEECLSRPFSPPDILLRVKRTLERLEENRTLVLSNAVLSGAVRRGQETQDETRRSLKDRVAGIQSIVDFNQAIDPGLDRGEAQRMAIRQLSAMFGAPGACLFERSGPDSAWFTPASWLGVPESRVRSLRVPASGEFLRILISAGRPLRIEEFERIPGTAWEAGSLTAAGFSLAAPLVIRREPVGFVCLSERSGGDAYESADLELLSLVTSTFAHLLEIGRTRDEERHRGTRGLALLVDRIEARDPFLAGHSRRVARLAAEIARRTGASERDIAEIIVAAHLHDVGITELTPGILFRPGPLTPDEWTEVRRHPDLGARVAREAGWPDSVVLAVRHHHERWDGTGYPAGLKGDEIPAGARILAVAEAFDAMSSARPYRGPMSATEIERTLKSEAGSRYDPRYVEVILQLTEDTVRQG